MGRTRDGLGALGCRDHAVEHEGRMRWCATNMRAVGAAAIAGLAAAVGSAEAARARGVAVDGARGCDRDSGCEDALRYRDGL